MARKTRVKTTASFNLGDRVRIKDFAGQVGRIAELRGPLGPGGASVYRVKVQKKPRVSYIELLGDQLEYLPTAGQAVRVKRHKAAPKTKKG
jgi:hypothetical protein